MKLLHKIMFLSMFFGMIIGAGCGQISATGTISISCFSIAYIIYNLNKVK